MGNIEAAKEANRKLKPGQRIRLESGGTPSTTKLVLIDSDGTEHDFSNVVGAVSFSINAREPLIQAEVRIVVPEIKIEGELHYVEEHVHRLEIISATQPQADADVEVELNA